jgi:hypothetical protein
MGLAASAIGGGFLASGLVTVTIPNGGSLSDLIQVCVRPSTLSEGQVESGAPYDPSQTIQVNLEKWKNECGTEDKIILVAIVMLFGFSERALTSFEERVFPSKS